MRVYIDCLELRSLNRRKENDDENQKKKTTKERNENCIVFFPFSS